MFVMYMYVHTYYIQNATEDKMHSNKYGMFYGKLNEERQEAKHMGKKCDKSN